MTEIEETRVAVFRSIHYLLAAERLFHRHRVHCDLIPMPRGLSSDCGMALAFRARDAEPAGRILSDSRLRLRGIFRLEGADWRRLEGGNEGAA